MDKQHSAQPNTYRPPFNPASRFPQYKISIPEKKTSPELVSKLFLTVAEGNYLKIKEFILANQISMISKNETGESVLHLIIKNSNITEQDKLQLVRFCIEKGAQVTSYDQNNVTPLHLACKFQLVGVVNLLLEKNANVKASDSQYKTPLHYAVVGENKECISNITKSVNALIPTKSAKTDKKEKNKLILELHSLLNEYLLEDAPTKMHMEQIKHSVSNFENMFPYDFSNLIEQGKQTIIDTLTNSQYNDADKKRLIFEKVSELKSASSELVNKKIADSITNLEIKPNTNGGWGPNEMPQNTILEHKSIIALSTDVNTTTESGLNDKSTKLIADSGSIADEISKISLVRDDCKMSIAYSHIYATAIEIHDRNVNRNGASNIFDNLRNHLFSSNPLAPINIPTLRSNEYVDPNTGDMLEYVTGTNIGNIPDLKLDAPMLAIYSNNHERERVSKSEVARIEKNKQRLVKYNLTREIPLLVGNDLRTPIPGGGYNPPALGAVIVPNPISQVDAAGAPIVGTDGAYFDIPFNVYISLLEDLATELTKSASNINNDLENRNFYNLYKISIPTTIEILLSVSLNMTYVGGELHVMRKHLSGIKHYFEHLRSSPVLPRDKSFLCEQMESYLSKSIKGIEQLETQLNNTYKSIKGMSDLMGDILVITEKLSCCTCIDAYFEGHTFDTIYSNPNTGIINNIFTKPIQRPKDFPETLDKFTKLRHGSLADIKKMLIEKYMPQITVINSTSFMTGARPPELPKIGFLGSNTFIPNLKDTARNPILLELAERTRGSIEVDDPNPAPNNLGTIGVIAPTTYLKTNKLPLTIGSHLGTYLLMIKYSIVRWIIQKTYDFLLPGPAINTLETSIKTVVTALLNQSKDIIKLDDDNFSFILVLVGKYVDQIITDLIKGLAINQTNKILLKTLEQHTFSEHYLHTITQSIIPIPDSGISLKLNEIFDDLEILYFDQAIVSGENMNAYAVGDLHDDQQVPNKVHKLINFNYEINSLEQTCFKIDTDIIDLLLKYSAYVNSKDNLGNSPIYYAIEMQNISVIQKLLARGAVVHSNMYKNKFDKSAFEYAWEGYEKIVDLMMTDKYKICSVLTKNIIQKIKKKPEFGNNVLRYSKILLPLSLYLLNHQIYVTGKGYPNEWSYLQNELFEKTLGLSANSLLPLLEITITHNETSKLDVPNSKLTQLDLQIKELTHRLDGLNKQLNSLEQELSSIVSKTVKSENDNAREIELNTILSNMRLEITSLNIMIVDYKNKIIQIGTVMNDPLERLKTVISTNKRELKRFGSVKDIYESVFVDVLNKDSRITLKKKKYDYFVDVKTYPMLWKKYFSGTGSKDYTQILDIITEYQKSIISKSEPTHNKIQKLQIISQYYKNVIMPFAKNYFDLPREYNGSNYAMTIILDIIVHIVQRIIIVNLYGAIVKSLTKYVLATFNKKSGMSSTDYQNYLLKLIIGVLNDKGTGDNESRLLGYIFDILPLKIVKVILKIYEGIDDGEGDIDKEHTSLEPLFNTINKILAANVSIDLTEDSSVLSDLREYVYPYFIEYLDLYVKEMFNLISNYLRSLSFQAGNLEILDVLATKARAEILSK